MDKDIPYTDKLNRWSSHHLISRMLDGLPGGSRVLDVGTGSGILARLCAGRGYIIRGIEPNISWLGNARGLYTDVVEGRLEQTPDTFLEGQTAVVCGDILEHLVSPEQQLHRLVRLQPEGCLFVISVPNVANFWIRLSLLFGRFDYTERGILDRSHLYFFTRKTFLHMLDATGLTVMELQVTPIPLDLVSPFFSQSILGRGLFNLYGLLARYWPTLLGYQFVAKAYKA